MCLTDPKYNECIIKSLYVRTSPMQIGLCEILHIFLANPKDFLIFVFFFFLLFK